MFNFGALRGRLILGFSLIAILTIGSTILRSVQLDALERAEASKSELADPYDHALSDASVSAKAAANEARGYLLTGDEAFIEEFESIRVTTISDALNRAEKLYEQDSLETLLIIEIRQGLDAWLRATRAEFELFKVDRSAAIEASLGVNLSLRKYYETLIDNATALSHRNVESADGTFNSELGSARSLGLVTAVGSLLTALLLALWIVRTMFAEHKRVTQDIELEASASTFAHELGDALEMAEDCQDVVTVASAALNHALPNSPSRLMLADSSESNLQVVADHANNKGELCSVATLWACPAIRRGRTQTTHSSKALDACPKLKELGSDACSATCSPVMFMGKPLGVLHSINAVDHDWETKDQEILREISGAVGNRLGVLRILEQTKHQAATDPLTGLANRRTLEDHVNKLVRSETPYVIAMCDLDNFKEINDNFGHDIGDRSLRRFARVLEDVTRSEDLVARYGGDEFVVVFPNMAETDAIAPLERVRENLAIVSADSRSPVFTASFGICGADDASDLEEAFQNADEALLAAKRAGRNRVMTFSQSRLDSHANS